MWLGNIMFYAVPIGKIKENLWLLLMVSDYNNLL